MTRLGTLLALVFLLLVPLPAQDSKENADFRLAVNLFGDKFYDLALEQFRQFVSVYPNTQQGIEARYYLGLTQKELRRYDDSRLTFQNFALSYSDHPKAPEAWMRIAETHLAEKSPREAALSYERIKTFHARTRFAPEGLRLAAALYGGLEDRENELRVLKVLTQEYPSTEAMTHNLRLAELYAELGQPDNALKEARTAVEGSKDPAIRARGLILQARMFYDRGRLRDAEDILQDIIRNFSSTPTAPEAHLLLGTIHIDRGDISAARQAWQSVADDPSVPAEIRQDAFLRLGALEENASNMPQAHRFYVSASGLRTMRTSLAAFRAGRTAERMGDTVSAAKYYEQSVEDTATTEQRPERLIGGVKAAVWTRRLDRVAQSGAELERSYPDHDAVPRVLLLWAENLLHAHPLEGEAAQVYSRAMSHPLALSVADRARLGLARSYVGQGDARKALSEYRWFLDHYPAAVERETAKKEKHFLETHVIRDQDAGIEQLALLLGEMIGERSSALLSFRLAEISFLQLKNFALARDHYRRAIQAGLSEEYKPVAMFRLAQSMEFLSEKPDIGKGERDQDVRLARQAYDELIRRYPTHPLAADALSNFIRLLVPEVATADQLMVLASRVDSLNPGRSSAIDIALELGRRAQELKAHDEALRFFGQVVRAEHSGEAAGEALARAGGILIQIGAIDTARTLLERCIGETGDHAFVPDAGMALARILSDSGDIDMLHPLLQRLSETYVYAVDTAVFALLEADAYLHSGRPVEASQRYSSYREMLERDAFFPRAPETSVLFRSAVAHREAGQAEQALGLFAEVVARSPSPEVLLECMSAIASLAEAMGDLPRAASAAQEAAKIAQAGGGDVWSLRLQSADLLFRNEQYGEAMGKYTDLLKTAVTDSLQTILEARVIVCAFRQDNLREADRRSTQFVRARPTAASYAATFEFERARYLTRKGDLDLARRRFEIIIRQYPTDALVPDAMYWLGRTFELADQPDSAGMLYDSLLRRYPGHSLSPRVELSLANVFYTLEQWEKAVPLYRRLIEDEARGPDLVQFAMNNLILAYKQLALYDAALEMTRTYISSYPDDPELINKRIDIGVLYQKLGYYDQSAVHLQDLLLTAPSDVEAELRYYIGEAHYYKGDYQQAILEFLKVPYLVTRRGLIDWVATSYYMAGQSYEKLSRFDQSIAMYRQIVERPGIDASFRTAAQREIDRVQGLLNSRRQ